MNLMNTNNVTANTNTNNVNANVANMAAAATTRDSARAIAAFDAATKNSMLAREGMLNEVCSAHERAGLTIDTSNIGGIDGMQPIAAMSTREFKRVSYRAYCAYLNLLKREITAQEALDTIQPLFRAYGTEIEIEDFLSVFSFALHVYGKGKSGEKERKVKSITTFRKFVRETISVYRAAKLTGNAGKEPAPLKEKKQKKATKAELEAALAAQAAENERLRAEMAAMKAANNADK